MNIISMSINDSSQTTDTNFIERSNKDINNNDNNNTGDHCVSIHNDKIFSDEGDCLIQSSYTIGINSNSEQICEEFIDFEQLIDSISKNKTELTLQDNIKEFEDVFTSFDTTYTDKDDRDLSLNEINDFFNTCNTENDVLDLQGILDVQNTESTADIETNEAQNVYNETTLKAVEKGVHKYESSTTHTDSTYVESFDPIISSNEDLNYKDNVIEIISISSKESQSDDGYNSSDFEFISESEAAIDGYIINFRRNDSSNTNLHNHNPEVANSKQKTMNTEQMNSDESRNQSENKNGAVSDPGEGPSGLKSSDRCYRPDHVIPEGDGYLDLFRGPYNPVMPMSDIIILENKSIRPSAMNVQYEGIGFDKQLIGRRYQPDSSEEEYADEAKESIKKILLMYPGENRRRRRRQY